MLLTVLVSVVATLYVLFCVGLYAFYYFIEVILDLPVVGQSPCTAHAALKQLIEKLLKEAVNLPMLQNARAHPSAPVQDTTNTSYEDLLATAIINKVVTGCQNHLPSSSANSVSSSRISTSSRNKDDREYFFGEETLDSKWKATDLDSTSASSLEEWLQCESAGGSKKYLDKVTLMIKQDIEEVDNFDSDNEQDDAEYFRSSSSLLEDSESNWLLQRRKFHGTHSPVPVPMLVPNPVADAKVLIGDKPIDDTSDLSDVGSDYEEAIQPTTTHTLLVQSKNLIGGGGVGIVETADNGDIQSESSTDSGVKEVNGKEQKSFDNSEMLKTDISLDDDNIDDSSFVSSYSNTEKEAEYTEKYASLPRQILKTSDNDQIHQQTNNEPTGAASHENGQTYERDSDFEFVGGSYTKKEKEKWKNAVEMKNNPYSKENIENRISRSNSAAGSIFGSDYYARLASKPSGGGKHSSQVNGVAWPSSEPSRSRSPSPPPALPKAAPPSREIIETEPSLEVFEKSPSVSSLEVPPELPKTRPPVQVVAEVDGIHQALRAIVTPVEEMAHVSYHHQSKSEAYRVESYTVATNSSEVTSDSDLSFVNFYDVEHSQIVKKSKNEDIHIPIKATPLGVSYKPLGDNNETVNRLHSGEDAGNGYGDDHVAKSRVLFGETRQENETFVKVAPPVKKRNMVPDKPILARNLSESNLLEGSYDAPPRVMHPKKDNTLISKIYKDPKVRLFALHSREETPSMEGTPNLSAFNNHRSVETKDSHSETSSLYLSKGRSQSSDDGLTSEYESGKTGRISFFSSEEDLLSLNSESGHVVDTRNQTITSSEPHFDHYSYIISPPATPSTKKLIYGSQEDLLSLDEVSCIRPRKDNTIISKIYQDPNVRNFALKTHKNFLPESIPSRSKQKVPSSDKAESRGKPTNNFSRDQGPTMNSSSSAEISLELYPDQPEVSLYSHEVDNIEHEEGDLEVGEIAKRHVVRQALGKFEKSDIQSRQVPFQRFPSVEEPTNSVRISVRELKNRFESNDNNNKPVVSSLTARSLSKQVKAALKQ